MQIINFIIFIIIVLVILTVTYRLFAYIIELWSGCSKEDAEKMIHMFFNNKPVYRFENDPMFWQEVWENVRNIIGENIYLQLERLSNSNIKTPLYFFNTKNGLPVIVISMYFKNDSNKTTLENILTNLIKKYLMLSEYEKDIIISWNIRRDLNMPYIEITYARNSDEMKRLNFLLKNEQEKIIKQNSYVTDDTEGVSLDEE